MSVIKKAQDLLLLTESSKGRMNALLSLSFQTLEQEVSSTMYSLYNTLPEDAEPYTDDAHRTPNPAFIPYESLTENQKIRRNLETAQAYFLLYHTIVSLKEVNTRNVMLTKATSGDGSLNPTDVEDLDTFRNILLANGRRICLNYKTTGDVSVIII